jgi:hypothetical protein
VDKKEDGTSNVNTSGTSSCKDGMFIDVAEAQNWDNRFILTFSLVHFLFYGCHSKRLESKLERRSAAVAPKPRRYEMNA